MQATDAFALLFKNGLVETVQVLEFEDDFALVSFKDGDEEWVPVAALDFAK